MKRVNPMLIPVRLTVVMLLCSGGQITDSASLILDPPVDQTVPVNSTAVFSCRVTGFLVWEIDTLEISDSRRNAFCSDRGVCVNGTLDNSPDETESVLLVAANELNNNSTIRCLASETIVSPAEASEAAVLTTFDRPAAPTHLLSSPVRHLHLNISWSAPVLFPGTETSYTITIRNVNTSEEIQREGLEVTHFIFNGTGGGSVCDVYQFRVAAVNSAGSSDQSEASSHSLPSLPNITGSIASMNSDVVLENGLASICISFEPAQSCQEYPVTNHSIVLQNSSADDTTVFGPFSPSEDGKVQVELENFAENAQYSFRVTAENSVGSITSDKTQFFTTDVQNASVSRSGSDEDSVIIITCRFAEGSQALGCHVELRIQSSVDMTMDISMHNESLEATSGIITLAFPLSCYDICAFDWESDGTRGELCVPVRVNESLSGNEDCGNGPSPESSSPKSQLVIGVIIGGIVGFLLLLIALVAAILLVSCYCMRAKRVRAKGNDYGDGCNGVSGKYKKGVHVEEIPSYHPTAPERSDSQATTVTMLPLLPVYDAIQNYSRQDGPDCEEKDYSSLARGSQLTSPTPRADFTHDPQYSALNQVPTYAVLESNSVPLGILPHQEAYCEIDDLKRHESTAVAVSDADTSMVPENERLYSEIPSAGTTIY